MPNLSAVKNILSKSYILKITFYCFLTFHCCKSSEISVSEIEKYASSEFAMKSGVDEFFERRMKNKPRKALVGNWEILFENDEHVYYGYPRFRRLFSDERVVEKIYFTPKKELENKFPLFRDLTGSAFRLKLYDSIFQYRKSNGETESFSLGFQDFSATLKENTIEAKAVIHFSSVEANKKKSENYKVFYNKNNLTLLKIEKL